LAHLCKGVWAKAFRQEVWIERLPTVFWRVGYTGQKEDCRVEIDFYQIFEKNPLILIFSVLGLGLLAGRISIAGTALGPTIGVLIVGLFFGHFGLTVNEMVGTFGFALFIFSVGLQAGPSFFSAFRADGVRYVGLSLLVAVIGVALTISFVFLFDLPAGLDAGMMAGALTSTPSLAGAQDAFLSGLGSTGDLTAAEAYRNVSIGYAITYLGGTAGVIVFVTQLPKLLGLDLEKEARLLEDERGLAPKRRAAGPASLPIIRAYEIREESVGHTLAQARQDLGVAAVPLRIKRGQKFVDADPELVLETGDVVSIFAPLDVHKRALSNASAEVLDPVLLDYEVVSREIVVLADGAIGRPLRDIGLVARHGCFATGVSRSGIELPFSESIVLNRGDRVHVIGESSRLESAAGALGYVEEDVEETDLVTFSFGIAAGAALGLILFKVGNVSIGLGMAGGLLLMGILIGFASSLNPTFGRVPQPARYLLMELGLMLFMTRVGLSAGGGILETLMSVGPVIIMCGLAITLVPACVAYFVGRRVMNLNPALLLGSVTGAMTSTPSLNVLNKLAKSPVPALGYAGTYTIANVLLTFAGTLIAVF
jgi:putative transport protein